MGRVFSFFLRGNVHEGIHRTPMIKVGKHWQSKVKTIGPTRSHKVDISLFYIFFNAQGQDNLMLFTLSKLAC